MPPSWQGTRWLDVLKVQVCFRLIDRGSDWRLHRHWYAQSALRDPLGTDRVIASNTLYRCLDKLVALIVTLDGFPLAYEVMPGNTTDQTTLAGFLAQIEQQYGRSLRVWTSSWASTRSARSTPVWRGPDRRPRTRDAAVVRRDVERAAVSMIAGSGDRPVDAASYRPLLRTDSSASETAHCAAEHRAPSQEPVLPACARLSRVGTRYAGLGGQCSIVRLVYGPGKGGART